MRLRFADSATKHGITHDQSRHVIEHAGRRWIQPSPAGGVPGDRLVYLGDDEGGPEMTTSKKQTTATTYKHKTVRELTTEDVERLATEAEEGYDLSKARPQRVGRPRLDAKHASVRISLRAAPELRAKLEHQAKREGRRVSDVARDALERYVS
jgi:hypothetical protein